MNNTGLSFRPHDQLYVTMTQKSQSGSNKAVKRGRRSVSLNRKNIQQYQHKQRKTNQKAKSQEPKSKMKKPVQQVQDQVQNLYYNLENNNHISTNYSRVTSNIPTSSSIKNKSSFKKSQDKSQFYKSFGTSQHITQYSSPERSPVKRYQSENQRQNKTIMEEQINGNSDNNPNKELDHIFENFHNNFEIKFDKLANINFQNSRPENHRYMKKQPRNNHNNNIHDIFPEETIIKPLTQTFLKLSQNQASIFSPLKRRQKNVLQSQPVVMSIEKIDSNEKTQKIQGKSHNNSNNPNYDSYINEILRDQQKTLIRQKKKMNLSNLSGNSNIIGKITLKVPKQKSLKHGFFQDTNGDIYSRDRIQTINDYNLVQQQQNNNNNKWKFQQYQNNDNIFQQQQQQSAVFQVNPSQFYQDTKQSNENPFLVKPIAQQQNNLGNLNKNQQQNIMKLNRKIQAGKNTLTNNSGVNTNNNNNLGTFLQNMQNEKYQKQQKQNQFYDLNKIEEHTIEDKENINPNIQVIDQKQQQQQQQQQKQFQKNSQKTLTDIDNNSSIFNNNSKTYQNNNPNNNNFKTIIFKESLQDITQKLKKNKEQYATQNNQNIFNASNNAQQSYFTNESNQQVFTGMNNSGKNGRNNSLYGRKNEVYQRKQGRQQSLDNYQQQNRLMKQQQQQQYQNRRIFEQQAISPLLSQMR